MNMQTFYKWLSVKPSQSHQKRLAGLKNTSRAQVLKATEELTWLIWSEEEAGTQH